MNATGGTMPAYNPPADVELVQLGAGSVHFGPIGAAWPGDFKPLGWCDDDGLTADPELTTERLADFGTALNGGSFTITGVVIPPRLYRLLTGLQHPRIRRMHREYARRLKARRRRRR